MILLNEILNVDKIKKVIDCENIPTSDHNENIKVILQSYLLNNGKVKYKQINNFGRHYSDGGKSLQFFQKDIRKYLADDKYIDIDIINCHPILLEQLFQRYLITVPVFLQEYNLNRTLTIKKYNLQDKLTFLIILNTDKYNGSNNLIYEFHKSLYTELLPKLIVDFKIPKSSKKENKDGSSIAKILQHIENDLLMIMYLKCKSLKVKVGVLVFDGMMIEKSSYYTDLLDVLSQEIKLKSNFIVKITEKSMDTTWSPIKLNVKDDCEQLIKEHFDHELYDYKETSKGFNCSSIY